VKDVTLVGCDQTATVETAGPGVLSLVSRRLVSLPSRACDSKRRNQLWTEGNAADASARIHRATGHRMPLISNAFQARYISFATGPHIPLDHLAEPVTNSLCIAADKLFRPHV
jgi:hypothetical protein